MQDHMWDVGGMQDAEAELIDVSLAVGRRKDRLVAGVPSLCPLPRENLIMGYKAIESSRSKYIPWQLLQVWERDLSRSV